MSKKNAKKTTTNKTSKKTAAKRSKRSAATVPSHEEESTEALDTAEVTEVPAEATEAPAEATEATEAPAADEDEEDADEGEDDAAEDADDATAPAETKRLPNAGTVIKKVDRHGRVRCQCTVVEGGQIRYGRKVYSSLSAAAMAAAHDLGLTNKTQNGWTFWGLTKPPRKISDPVEAIQKSAERFRNAAAAALGAATDENRGQVRAALKEQGEAIKGLLGAARA